MSNPFQLAKDSAQNFLYVKKNLFAPKEQELKYLVYRVVRPLLKVYNRWVMPTFPDTPWLAPAAIRILDRLLTKEMNGFEFGSGASTLFVAGRVQGLISLEHTKEWYEIVNQRIRERGYHNIELHLIKPKNDPTKTNNLPQSSYENMTRAFTPASCYENYYSFIDAFPDDRFDFILVDGRARVECAQRAISKLKSGGFLMLDNSERLRYKGVHDQLATWDKVNTTTGLTDTTFWFKP